MSIEQEGIPISMLPELLKKCGIDTESPKEKWKKFKKLNLKDLGSTVNYSLPKKDKDNV